ncbi:hypothetical protein GCM10022200_02180 [Microbacterium awajiense]|uniref:DUF4013 domain-containing protein n=1 Tax=Microbacterium awajiense TaxID=415214 RepID=A0ABP7A294_9MICO
MLIDLDPTFALAFNSVVVLVLIGVAVGALLSMRSRTTVLNRADRYSVKSRLPYGTDQTRESVARGLRARANAVTGALLAAGLVALPLLFTPLGTNMLFVFFVIVTALVAGGTIATVAVNLRERLFHPAPDAPRVARARRMMTADYLGPARRALPWVLLAAASVATFLLAGSQFDERVSTEPMTTTAAFIFACVAAVAFAVLPRLDRLILDRAQPASDTLELAWDDAFRAYALSSLRLSAAIAAWFALAFSLGALCAAYAPPSVFFAMQLPTWGIVALQFVYPNTGRPLPESLYPDWLRRPVTVGAPA